MQQLTLEEAYREFSKTDKYHHTRMDYGTFEYIWNLAIENSRQQHTKASFILSQMSAVMELLNEAIKASDPAGTIQYKEKYERHETANTVRH